MDVVIIGAGLSGLTAATVLRDAGADVLLIEAEPQVGGRIRAHRNPATNEYLADLGPTWVWPKYQPVVANWAQTLGLKTFEQYNEGEAVILGYGPAPLRQPLPGQDGMVRIVGGPTAYIDALFAGIDAARIRTSTLATAIHEDGSERVSIHLKTGEVITTERAVISIPLRIAAANLEMPWAPQALLDAMRRIPTWMSTHSKAVALYGRPFWRDAGLAGRIASRAGPLVEAHDHSGANGTPAAIFGFVGWPPDIRRENPVRLRQAILKQLAECFGPPAEDPIDLVVQDWATTPNIVTDLDLAQPANYPEVGPDVLRQAHLNGRVRFAVSETSQVSPGLIEGALVAGEQAARDVLASTRT